MNNQDIQQAFEAAYQQDPRDGLTVNHIIEDGHFRVEVRHQDVDGNLRGFNVVAEPTEAEERSAGDIGQAMAQVVAQELAYGQLPARDEGGEFKRIVV